MRNTLCTIVILFVSINLIKTQGPRSGSKRNGIKDLIREKSSSNECTNCTDDKVLLLINTRLKEYQNSNLKNCNISHGNLSEWCIQKLKVMLDETASVCKIYPFECECLKLCYEKK